MVTMQNLLTVL